MLLDRLSRFLAQVRGLPIILGVCLVLLNFIFQFFDIDALRFLAETNLLLHLGVVLGLLGVLLAEALGRW
jgi:hypothetical protein